MSTALVLVTGSQSWRDVKTVNEVLETVWDDALQLGCDGITLLHGDCEDGADFQARLWADANGIAQEKDPADWEGPCTDSCQPGHRKKYLGVSVCPAAGPLRNQRMVDRVRERMTDDVPALCVAFHRNNSRGTRDCKRRARKAQIPVLEVTTSPAHPEARCTTL